MVPSSQRSGARCFETLFGSLCYVRNSQSVLPATNPQQILSLAHTVCHTTTSAQSRRIAICDSFDVARCMAQISGVLAGSFGSKRSQLEFLTYAMAARQLECLALILSGGRVLRSGEPLYWFLANLSVSRSGVI